MSYNPFYEGFNHLNDQDLDEKMQDLVNKYFKASKSPHIQEQIKVLIDMCREEKNQRLYEKYYKSSDEDNDLDDLININ